MIDHLKVTFKDGFSIITGETGAGKSILLGGLGLILGKRADLSVINDTTVKCIVEAEFNIENYKLQKIFKSLELDYESQTIIRREILPSGKSRAFINDSPVALNVLKKVSEALIDIHSQHETLQLTDNLFQFEVIDALAKNDTRISTYSKDLESYKATDKALQELLVLQQNATETHEYNSFLLEELLSAKLETLHQENLEKELEQLNNVEDIQQQLLQANQLCSNENIGILNLLAELKGSLKGIIGFSENYNSLFERVNSTHIELEDVFGEIEQAQEHVEANPQRLEEVTTILNNLQSLLQKHKVATVDELIVIQNDLDAKVGVVANLDQTISEQTKAVAVQKKQLQLLANELSENRQKAIPKLTQQLEKILKNLGMENAQFDITIHQENAFLSNGTDVLSFLFSANKGGSFNELKKAASGGELSRIMLAIKAILSKYKKLPTIMFDEIDTGVSGDVAHKMGMLMQYMSENMQVFSITHLSQIASKGETHFKVYKEDVSGKTRSDLKELSSEERINEIAEMIGGKNLTNSAINHAKELLSR